MLSVDVSIAVRLHTVEDKSSHVVRKIHNSMSWQGRIYDTVFDLLLYWKLSPDSKLVQRKDRPECLLVKSFSKYLNSMLPVLNRHWHSLTVYTTRVPSQAQAWFNHQR